MSANLKMEKILQVKKDLDKKLVNEGLTKNQQKMLSEINRRLNEAPIDYEGPERMEPGIERQIVQRQTPYHQHPALPSDLDRDFIEAISSQRFKDSVEKVRRFLGDTRPIQGDNAFMGLMSTVMGSLQQIVRFQSEHKEYLENLAVDLVKKELGIPEGQLQFDVELVSTGMGASEGMQRQSQQPDEEEVEQAFQEGEEHQEEIEDFMDSMEKFNLEKAKRRMINSLIQGAAFKGGHMYVLVSDEINRLNPQLLNLYGVTQSLMEHLYWLYPDMEMMAGSGGGQLGQSESDPETDPPTIKAKALTFPLLVHEIVKGIYSLYGDQGLPNDPVQRSMVVSAEDTLPNEVWDSRLGPIFWEKFRESWPDRLYNEDERHLQQYLFMKLSQLNAQEFIKLAKAILADKPEAKTVINKMVNEVIQILKDYEYEKKMGEKDEDDDIDFDNLDDIDLSDLGF
ncbi:MAG: hypothetical protein EBS55_10770 [Flavobacteriaceae bacterium]|nr:hypothetical protein [Flavobacteriaceae bacterium]